MDSDVRKALNFPCLNQTLSGTVDQAGGGTGILLVTGGRQTRIGPHRMMARLAAELADAGYSVFRFDRRGVGDSDGDDPGFRGSEPDIGAAIAAFREACPDVCAIWGMGLCDGATALALHHQALGLEGLILLNPWVVEAQAGTPPAAAIRAHYRERLLTLEGWHKLLTRGFSPMGLLRGVAKILGKEDQSLADDVMKSLAGFQGTVTILLAERDATARAFLDQYRGTAGAPLRQCPNITLSNLDSASHSFASPDDHDWLLRRILDALPAC